MKAVTEDFARETIPLAAVPLSPLLSGNQVAPETWISKLVATLDHVDRQPDLALVCEEHMLLDRAFLDEHELRVASIGKEFLTLQESAPVKFREENPELFGRLKCLCERPRIWRWVANGLRAEDLRQQVRAALSARAEEFIVEPGLPLREFVESAIRGVNSIAQERSNQP